MSYLLAILVTGWLVFRSNGALRILLWCAVESTEASKNIIAVETK